MKTVINLTAEEIQDSYSSNYGEDLTAEQLAKIVDEVQGRADNFLAELLRDLFDEVFFSQRGMQTKTNYITEEAK